MTSPRRQLLVPAALALGGVVLLAGCIPIPVFKPPGGQVRPEKRIGRASSNKPLKLGRATREDAVRVLGTPHSEPGGGASLLFEYEVIETVMFYPLCFMAWPDQPRARFLRLDFGPDGTLRKFKVSKDPEGNF